MAELVTIVTGYYNRGYCVSESVRSLLDQTYKNIEVIVFDDASTDDTYEKLSSLSDARLTVIRHKKNIGFVRGLINAIEKSKGTYIAIHGSGDISYRNRIALQAEYLRSHENCVVVGCNIDVASEDGTLVSTRIRADKEVFVIPCKSDFFVNRLGNVFSQGEVMFKRSAYERVGGYRDFFYFAQDYDLWRRFHEVGDICILNEVLYKSVSRQDGVRNDVDRVIMQKYYSDMAKQSATCRLHHEPDPVEVYGNCAFLFRKRSLHLHYRMIQIALACYLNQQTEHLPRVLKLAYKETVTLECVLLTVVYFISKVSYGFSYKLFLKIRKYIKNNPHEMKPAKVSQ